MQRLIYQDFRRTNVIVLRHDQCEFMQSLDIIETTQDLREMGRQFDVSGLVELIDAVMNLSNAGNITHRLENARTKRPLSNRCDTMVEHIVQRRKVSLCRVWIVYGQQLQFVRCVDVCGNFQGENLKEKLGFNSPNLLQTKNIEEITKAKHLPICMCANFVSKSNLTPFSLK